MSSFEEQYTGLEAEEGRATTSQSHTSEDNEDEWEDVNSSSGEENETQNWNDIPTFDLITNRTIGSPYTPFVSPFKRVLRRTGPLPPDSDSEYDSASETEEALVTPEYAPSHLNDYMRDRDRTWWWLVSASLDEIKPDDRNYDEEGMARREYEDEHVDPFVVYMLPLMASVRHRPLRHGRGKVRPRDGLVQGLLLVKDGKDVEQKSEAIGKPEVLFKRIGHFSNCPKINFDKATIREVTII